MSNKFRQQIFSRPAIVACCLLLWTCTSNPFDTGRKLGVSTAQSGISGTVLLSDGTSAENVYIWLEGFNIATSADENGHFQLKLPRPREQAAGGVTGIYYAYFYVANYWIEAVKLVLIDGEFVFGQGDINLDGQLIRPLELRKIAEVSTTVFPETVPENCTARLGVTVTVKPLVDSLLITGIEPAEATGNDLGAYLVARSNLHRPFARVRSETLTPFAAFLDSTRVWHLEFVFTPYYLPAGEYEIIPFLEIFQPGIPEKLLDHLGYSRFRLGADYLNLPFERQAGLFLVLPPDSICSTIP